MKIQAPLLLVVTFTGLSTSGCFEEPCQDYVDYVCSCHEDDPEFDCDYLRTIYEDAEPDVQDSCAISLDELQSEDEAEGYYCEY